MTMAMGQESFLGFGFGEQGLAIRISDVLEITEISSVCQVPGAPSTVVGVTDIRGQVVTVINTAELLYLRGESGSWIARLAAPRQNLGLQLGGSIDIFRLPSSAVRHAPDPSGLTFEEVVTEHSIRQLLSVPAIVSRLDEEMVTALGCHHG